MKNIWFWSDLHLGHENMYRFLNWNGTKVRPWEPEQMHEAEELMLQEYNKVVKPEDTCYWLGDISSRNDVADKFFSRLIKSRRILVMGNHDNKLGVKFWLKHFDDVRGCYNLSQKGERTNYLITHIPVHPASKGRFKRNITGHIHSEQVYLVEKNKILKKLDPWYRNVSVEVTGYKPVNFDEIVEETEKLIENGLIVIPKKGERT